MALPKWTDERTQQLVDFVGDGPISQAQVAEAGQEGIADIQADLQGALIENNEAGQEAALEASQAATQEIIAEMIEMNPDAAAEIIAGTAASNPEAAAEMVQEMMASNPEGAVELCADIAEANPAAAALATEAVSYTHLTLPTKRIV